MNIFNCYCPSKARATLAFHYHDWDWLLKYLWFGITQV